MTTKHHPTTPRPQRMISDHVKVSISAVCTNWLN